MMRKFFKWLLVLIGVFLIAVFVGLAALPFVFPLEKIKDFAIAKLSETIHREVRIEKVSFNIFSGIRLEKLSIGNRTGWASKPFVSADAIELRYAFWPLFSRQILIKEISLVSPQILIEKRGSEFNYSDC